jgi:hypothetical protein
MNFQLTHVATQLKTVHANARPWLHLSSVPTCDHGLAFACTVLSWQALCHQKGRRNAILSKQQECILRKVCMISVALGCILVARSCIDNSMTFWYLVR